MQTIIVRSQAEWDALPEKFSEFTTIHIQCGDSWLRINRIPGSSHVEAWGSSHVVAWGSSHVVARESSHVVAWGQSAFHQRSRDKQSELHGQAVCFLYDGAGVPIRKSDNATIIQVQNPKGVAGWLEQEGVVEASSKVILYKRVSKDFLTQEGQPWQTTWVIGEVVSHPSWAPVEECGAGQFHACSRPYFCDEFRSTVGDGYVAIEVKLQDLHVHEIRQYQHKVSFRECIVLHRVDRFGKKIESVVEVSA